MTQQAEDTRPILYLFTPSRDFVRPYFERLMPDWRIADSPRDAQAAVMISSIGIYDATEGRNFNELTPLRADSSEASDEKTFTEICAENNIGATILRCADIIGTGMTGYPRKLANQIYRGVFVSLKSETGLRSFVHASSLPSAAQIAIGSPGIYNVTDLTDTSVNDIADALAWRIAQKRIFTLGPKWYKFIFGHRKLNDIRRSLTFSCAKLCSVGSYEPVRAVDYLKTHVYDEQSL